MNDWLPLLVFLGLPLAIMLYGFMERRSKKKKWTEAWFSRISNLVGTTLAFIFFAGIFIIGFFQCLGDLQ